MEHREGRGDQVTRLPRTFFFGKRSLLSHPLATANNEIGAAS